MFIIKHIYHRGSGLEEVFPGVASTVYDSEKKTLSAVLVNPPSFMAGNIYKMDSGIVYLMNENGKTVETYHLGKAEEKSPHEGEEKKHYERKQGTLLATGTVYSVNPDMKRMTLRIHSRPPDAPATGSERSSNLVAYVYLGESFNYDGVKSNDAVEVRLVHK